LITSAKKEIAMNIMNRAIGIVGIGVLFGACSQAVISPNWGVAYHEMRAKQVLNPAAGERLDPVEGQDGRVSATATEAYRQSFEKPDAEFGKSVVSSGLKTQ
jgi:hypothetical protein